MSFEDKQLKKFFKKLENNSSPSLDWLATTRSKLASHMKANPRPASSADVAQAERWQPKTSFWHSWLFKPATVMAVALIILLGGGTTFVAQGAEPGETLYPLKLAGESFNLLIQVSPEAKAKLYMKYADRRLGEFEHLYEKRPGDKYWQEKVSGDLSMHMIMIRDNMQALDSDAKYADMALRFEELTARHTQRIVELEQRLNTSTIMIINHHQELNKQHRQKALQALEHAQELIKQHNGSQEFMKQRLEARLELLRIRQESMQDRFDKRFKDAGIDEINKLNIGDIFLKEKLKNIRVYQTEVDDDGLHFESELKIESAGSEDIETYINVNDGQVIINTSIRATGTSIFIHESSSIQASSSQSIRINGREVE